MWPWKVGSQSGLIWYEARVWVIWYDDSYRRKFIWPWPLNLTQNSKIKIPKRRVYPSKMPLMLNSHRPCKTRNWRNEHNPQHITRPEPNDWKKTCSVTGIFNQFLCLFNKEMQKKKVKRRLFFLVFRRKTERKREKTTKTFKSMIYLNVRCKETIYI